MHLHQETRCRMQTVKIPLQLHAETRWAHELAESRKNEKFQVNIYCPSPPQSFCVGFVTCICIRKRVAVCRRWKFRSNCMQKRVGRINSRKVAKMKNSKSTSIAR